jgi:predicted small integral membrane protein
MIDLEWMAWTAPTAVFFACIALMLVCLTALQIFWPTYERKGFLPIPTTRGDRVFIALILAAFVHLGFVHSTEMETFWVPLGVSAALALVILRWG